MNIGFNSTYKPFLFDEEAIIRLIDLNYISRSILAYDMEKTLVKNDTYYSLLNELNNKANKNKYPVESKEIFIILLYEAYKKGLKDEEEIKIFIYELLGLKNYKEVAINALKGLTTEDIIKLCY